MNMRVDREATTSDTEDGWMVRLNGTPFTGEVADTEDGRVVAVTTYREGIEHGPQWEYYPSGAKEAEGECAQGHAVGEWRRWYPDGKPHTYRVFDQWGDIRKAQRWNEQGELVEDEEYQGMHGGAW